MARRLKFGQARRKNQESGGDAGFPEAIDVFESLPGFHLEAACQSSEPL